MEETQDPPPAATPLYHLDCTAAPQLLLRADNAPLRPHLTRNNFHKAAKWSPDGSMVLTNSDDNVVRAYTVPLTCMMAAGDAFEQLQPTSLCALGESVYDMAWYPGGADCYIVSSRDHPIELRGAFDGHTRVTYPTHNHLDEIVAPNTLAFNLDGSYFYGGFEGKIRVYDVSQPGDAITTVALTPTRKSKQGQKGLVSCIAFCPDGSGVYAVGSFSGTIGLYTEDNDTLISLAVAHPHGVTHLKYTPNGRYLVSGGRKDDDLLVWDVQRPDKPLRRLARPCPSNQRLSFDFDFYGRYLVAGEHDGRVSIYDAARLDQEGELKLFSFWAHGASVPAAALHPTLPLLMTGSGERRYMLNDLGDRGEDAADIDDDIDMARPQDTTLKFWRFGAPWLSS